MTIILQQPCPPHYWAHGPTVDSYDCIKCRESRAWNHPQHAEAAREYASYVTAVESGESEDAPSAPPSDDVERIDDACSPIAHAAAWKTWQALDAAEQRQPAMKFSPQYRCMAVVQDAIAALQEPKP